MALAGALQQLMLIWGGGGGLITIRYTLPIKPNSGIINPLPFGGINSSMPNAKIQTYKPNSQIKNTIPSGGISNIIPNAN